MDGADQRRPHRLRRLPAVLTAYVAPPAPVLIRALSQIFQRPPARMTAPFRGQIRAAGRNAFDQRAPVLPSRLEASARDAIPGIDRADDSTAHEFRLRGPHRLRPRRIVWTRQCATALAANVD